MEPPTRDRIVAAALAGFARRGVEATSLDDVALAVGVRKQTVLYWFRSKDALVSGVVEAAVDELGRTLDAAVERFRTARGHDPARLEDLLAAGVLERVPDEPFGGAYVWRDGAVHSTGRDVRVEPAEPGRLRRSVPYKDAR